MARLSSKVWSKVPEVTLYFWIIKILCTTVGETAADFLNINLNLGLTGTSVITGLLLIAMLIWQFRTKRYIPAVYWLTVTLVSVFGTLVTDNLTDKMQMPLEISTLIFSGLLALTFLGWYLSEKTLSIHSVFTRRREMWYWLTILVTFALGTASGDLMAEGLALGYLNTGLIVAAIIVITAVAWKMRLHSVLAFWIIYILTRPLGASIGDLLSQPANHGGLGLGTTWTSILFLVGIFAIVAYLSLTKRDVIGGDASGEASAEKEQGGLIQTAIVLALIIVAAGAGYHVRHEQLVGEGSAVAPEATTHTASGASMQPVSPLGDLSSFRGITQDTLSLLDAGKQAEATTRIGDLEFAWDNAQAQLRPKDAAAWAVIDGKIDTVLRELRSVNPDEAKEKAALEDLLLAL